MSVLAKSSDQSITGVLERIIYCNEENAYCIAELTSPESKAPITMLGALPGVQCGETLSLMGRTAAPYTEISSSSAIKKFLNFPHPFTESANIWEAGSSMASVNPTRRRLSITSAQTRSKSSGRVGAAP